MRGRYRGSFSVSIEVAKAYCHACGKPLPWTVAALDAAREYTDELEQLTSDDREKLKGTFSDLTTDTARTPLAATRSQRFMKSAGPEAAKAMTQILVSVLTEEVKKQLGLK
jgi:hypothetical protein